MVWFLADLCEFYGASMPHLQQTYNHLLVLLCQLGCPRTSRPLDLRRFDHWHEKVCCHAVCLPLANVEHGVADPCYKRLLG